VIFAVSYNNYFASACYKAEQKWLFISQFGICIVFTENRGRFASNKGRSSWVASDTRQHNGLVDLIKHLAPEALLHHCFSRQYCVMNVTISRHPSHSLFGFMTRNDLQLLRRLPSGAADTKKPTRFDCFNRFPAQNLIHIYLLWSITNHCDSPAQVTPLLKNNTIWHMK